MWAIPWHWSDWAEWDREYQHPQYQGLEILRVTGLQHIHELISKTCLYVYMGILHPDRDVTHPENNMVTQLFLEVLNLIPADLKITEQ